MTGPFFRLPKAVAVIAFCLIGCSFGPAIEAETSIAQFYTSVTPATDNSPANPDPALTTEFVEPTLPGSTLAAPEDTTVVAAPEQTTTELSPSARRFHYTLSFDVRAAYDDNVTLSHNDPVDDLYGRIQAIVTLGLGDTEGGEGNHLGIVYTPSYYFYSDHSNFNAVEHLLRLEGLYRFSRLTLGLIEDIQSIESSHLESHGTTGTTINASNIDIGVRQRLTTYFTRLNATYDFSGKTSLTAGVDYTTTDYENSISSRTVMATLGIDYKLGPKFGVGLAGSGARNFVDAPSPDQSFEQINARMTYEITGKVTANASGGIEFRQFEGGTSDHTSPVFQVGINYQPFDGTALALNASRQNLNSAVLSNQDYASTQVTATLRQRLFQRLSISVSGGYQNLSYFNTVNGSDTAREDNYYFIQPGIDVTITRYWSAGAFYLHRINDSTITLFGFDENQFGVHSQVTF